jgi:hypothetical protein
MSVETAGKHFDTQKFRDAVKHSSNEELMGFMRQFDEVVKIVSLNLYPDELRRKLGKKKAKAMGNAALLLQYECMSICFEEASKRGLDVGPQA